MSPRACLRRRFWLVLIAAGIGGCYVVEQVARRPQAQAGMFLEGIAPTYADEFMRMGHADLQPETADKDPRYLAMIEAGQRWVTLNPLVSEIYTFRRRSDGVVYLMVDAETEYNSNQDHAISGERKGRIRLGEVYPDVGEELLRAFLGEKVLMRRSATDGRGPRVSVFVPMLDKNGKVEAVLGVDYDAELWAKEMTAARRMALALLAGLLVTLCGSAAVLAINRTQLRARIEAEGKLHETETRLHAMIDHLPFALWLMGPGGDCVAHNALAADTRGVRAGATFIEMRFDNLERKSLPGDVARARAGDIVTRDFTRELAGARRHYVQFLAPVPELAGGMGLVVVELDVTDRVEAELRCKESEGRLALHVEQTPLAYLEWDESLRILRWNAAAEQLFGYSAEEALGRSFEELIVPEEAREGVRKVSRLLLKQEGGMHFSNENRTKGGRIIFCEWHNIPLIDETGRVIAVASHAQNLTERMEMESRLRQTHKLESMGQLAGGVAHEFNNLLTPMLAQIGLVASVYAQDARLLGMLKPVEEAITQAAQLNQRILAVGRRSAEVVLPAKLNPLVENALDLLRLTLDRRIELRLELLNDLPMVPVTKEAIMQVVMNLTLNARDTLLEKLGANVNPAWSPCLIISSKVVKSAPADAPEALLADGRCARLSFHDNGKGMNDVVRRKLFEPFFTTKAPGLGTGLGLAVVWNSIDALGGYIDLESIEGEGTIFHVYLPISRTDAAPAQFDSPLALRNTDTAKGPSLRILLVDDNKLVRETFSEVLSHAGHSVETASDGQQGLENLLAATGRPYDLLLLDLNMPLVSGREVLKWIQGRGLARSVIVVSGLADSGENTDLGSLGVSLLLRKPVGMQELIRAVSDVSPKSAAT